MENKPLQVQETRWFSPPEVFKIAPGFKSEIMYLKKLSFLNYKNFDSAEFEFDEKVNCLVGPNGIGKSNVLDGIYHLAFGKSYFNPITSQNIRHGADFFMVDGELEKGDQSEKITVSAKKGQKKIIKRNGKAYEKLSEHIGFLPLTIISPADRDLIVEGSETRRKFMDGVISQGDKPYLEDLLSYSKVVAQRNALLKYFAANRTFDRDTLEVYNHQMQQTGPGIHEKRKVFLKEFTPIFKKRYAGISHAKEEVGLIYKSQLFENGLPRLLAENLQRDRALQYSSAGVHKDDLLLEINGHPIKKFGSQGQQKTYLIALKLAQYDFIKNQSKVKPILLLDDIFDKLDEERVAHIVDIVSKDGLGQLFISDTHADRTESMVGKKSGSHRVFRM